MPTNMLISEKSEPEKIQQLVLSKDLLVKEDGMYLMDASATYAIPLKHIKLEIEVQQSIATYIMTQDYVNLEEQPIETIFLFPVNEGVVFSKLRALIELEDGTKK